MSSPRFHVERDGDRAVARWHGPDVAGGPLLVFLHGMGECGADGERHLGVGLGPALASGRFRWPGAVLLPQKPERYVEWSAHAEWIDAQIESALDELALDASRIALTGLSQGGAGVLDLAARRPGRFTSVAAVCPYVREPSVGWARLEDLEAWVREPRARRMDELLAALRGTPLWLFHGRRDDRVPARFSMDLAEHFRRQGETVGLELYPDLGHAAWDRAYAHPGLPAFLGRAGRERSSG